MNYSYGNCMWIRGDSKPWLSVGNLVDCLKVIFTTLLFCYLHLTAFGEIIESRVFDSQWHGKMANPGHWLHYFLLICNGLAERYAHLQ
jgi:hypothetical protein